jgi:hypothetical protein
MRGVTLTSAPSSRSGLADGDLDDPRAEANGHEALGLPSLPEWSG